MLIMTNFTPTSKVSNKTLTFFSMLHYKKYIALSNFQMENKNKVLLVVEFIVFYSSLESPGFLVDLVIKINFCYYFNPIKPGEIIGRSSD